MDQHGKEVLKATQALGNLISKERTTEDQNKVEEIINKYKDVQTRVEKIKELDEKNIKSKVKSSKVEVKSNLGTNAAKRKKQPTATKVEEHHIGFFEFLFGSRKEVNDLASSSGVLSSKRFGTQFELSKQTIDKFKMFDIQKTANVEKKLNSALVDAWKYLDITNYNLLVQLNAAIDGYLKLSIAITKGNIEIEKLTTIGNDFFRSYYIIIENSKNITLLAQTIKKYYSNQSEKKYISNFGNLFSHVFSHKENQINFDEIIIGIFAAHHKKVFSVDQITKMINVETLDTNSYDVPPSIQQKIDVFMSNKNSKFAKVEMVLAKISFINTHLLTISNDNKYIFPVIKTVLIQVFEKLGVFDEKLKIEMQKSFSNPLKLLKNISYYLIYELIPILDSSINTTKKNDVRVFEKRVFGGILNQLKRTNEEITNFLEKHNNFQYSFNDFNGVDKENSSDDVVDQKALELCTTMLNIYYKIGESLLQVILNHTESEELEYNEKLNLKKNSNEPISSIESSSRFIPFYTEKMIGSKTKLDGLTTYEGILELAKIFYNVSLVFKHKSLVSLLKSKKEYEAQKKET